MADSSIIENLSEGVLTAFFGSFLGAAVGKDLAGITVNLLSSGIEKIGAKTFETITQDRTNHDIQKLASASLHASINDVLSESNDVGGKVTWRDSQKKALSELREYSKNQFMSESDVAGRIVSATMVGLSAEVENSVRQMIQPFLEQKDTIDNERLTQEISKRFFFNFNELYKSEKHEKGRLAIERDIARTLLQGLNSQTAIIADFKQKNQSQYETVVRLLDGIATTGLTDWNPNFDKVINAVNNLATESKEQINYATTEIKHHTASHIRDLANHITGEFASDRMESVARETFKQARQEFDKGNYALAAALFEKTADQASKSKAKDLEVNALLQVILSEINQATLVERSDVFPIDRWNGLLELARLHDERRTDRFITEARVAILSGDLDAAFERVLQARNEKEKHNYYIVEIARLSVEILSRKLKLNPQQSVIDSLVNEEKLIRMDLAAMSATSVVLIYSPIIEAFVATGIDITESIKLMRSSIAATDANKSERDPLTEAVALIRIAQAAKRLHGSKWRLEVARTAVEYTSKFGNAIEQAKIGDLLASVITESDCTKEDLQELLELRHKWCSGLSEDFTTLADLSDESFNLFLYHRAMAIRDRYRIAVLDVDQVDASEWFDLSNEVDAVTELIDQKEDSLTWPASRLAVNLVHIKAECLTYLGEYGKAADSFSIALKRGEEVAIDPETQLHLAVESVYFYCSAGNVTRARNSKVAAETICSNMGKVFEQGGGLDALIETTEETRRWLSSGDAETIRRTGRESGIREAMRPTIRHLFELWDDIPPNYNCHAAVYDYWGRGSFLRLCVAIQGKPTDCFTLDASSVDDIRLAAEMLCPMFEVVMVKWKGKLLGPQKGVSGGYVRNDMKQDWLYGSGLVHCKNSFVGYTNDLPDDVITFLRGDARKLVESGRLFVVPAQLIGCAQRFVGASDATFALQLLQGSFLGVGEDVDGVSKNVERSMVRLHRMKLPYYRDVNLSDLSDILDDVGGQARYFHSRIREMISAGDFEKAQFDAMKEDAIARRVDDAIMELREIYRSVDKSVSSKLDALSIDQMVAPRGFGVSGTNVTHMLSSILPVGSDLKAWIPFSRIAGAGGCFSWGSAPIRNAIPAPINTINFSWLAPPTIGAGASGGSIELV